MVLLENYEVCDGLGSLPAQLSLKWNNFVKQVLAGWHLPLSIFKGAQPSESVGSESSRNSS